MRRLITALLLAALLALPSAALAAPPNPIPGPDIAGLPIEPALLKEMLQNREASFRFIVELHAQAALDDLPAPSTASPAAARTARVAAVVERLRDTAATSQSGLLADLSARQAAGQVQAYTSLWIRNAVAVTAGMDTLLAVAARPEVRLVRQDAWRQWIAPAMDAAEAGEPGWNLRQVRADAAWSALGLDGSGVVVANVDTGVDWQHPALLEGYRGYTGGGPVNHTGHWFDATGSGYLYPGDGYGHGTHTMGTMAGRPTVDGPTVGLAPGARWIAAKAFDSQGSAYDSWIHSALQWMLAPAGDPALAPDVVNNSWGSADPYSQVFAPDIAGLTAAGIVSVFSAGNEGPGFGSVSSPASLPGVVGVGAVDATGLVATFSGRGPSPWGESKPALTAPGVAVVSSTPGGAYQAWNGTSMAAPHVAGAAALLLQAQPGLSVAAAAYAITSTAVPLRTLITDTVPNDTYGAGLLDVLAAALSVASTGSLSGTVTGAGGQPLPGATVTATGEESGLQATAISGKDGAYALPLAAGPYTVTAAAFGYYSSAPVRDVVITGAITLRDIALSPVPTGTLAGLVRDAGGAPLSATVSISGTALAASTDPATGAYSITLPEGAYSLRAEAWGHRLGFAAVTVTAAATATVDLALPAGPNVLVVDSGAWYNDPHGASYDAGLEALGYVHALHAITYTGALPSLAALAPYDVVVWSAPQDSPGLIRADGVLSDYLSLGGSLLVTGQDVAFWDGGGAITYYSPFLANFLHAAYVADDSGSDAVAGLAAEPFAGITLTLNTADSDGNQRSPDVVAPFDDRAAAVLAYGNGHTGGLRADICLPYRVLYLSFGLEGAGPRESRHAALDRAIAWLTGSRPAYDLALTPAAQTHIGPAAGLLTGTVRLWNSGAFTDTFNVTLGASPWPATLTDSAFAAPLPSPLTISSCQVITAGIAVTVPYDAPRQATVALEITAASAGDAAVSRTVGFTAKTPASLLLVDDDRWYDVEGAYITALQALSRTHDVWDTAWKGRSVAGPPASVLSMYPAVAWFNGYDWFDPLNAPDEAALTNYLDGGGRLFLSSQDYLYVRGPTPLTANYLGVLTYTNDITATTETGAPGGLFGGLGPYTPTAEFHMWPDIVTPTLAARAAFLNPDGDATSLTLDGGGFRSAFFTFPFEGLPAGGRLEAMRRSLDWFGPLRASTFSVDQASAAPGATLRYALTVENPGQVTATVWVTNTLPAALALDAASLHGGTYDAGAGAVLWSGEVAPGGRHAITYTAAVDPVFRGWVRNQAQVSAPGETFAVTARTVVPVKIYLPLVSRL